MSKRKRILFSEVILLIASVFIFRSVWLLVDMIPAMHTLPALLVSLIISILITVPALRYIIRHDK